jgi:hypothetical protein
MYLDSSLVSRRKPGTGTVFGELGDKLMDAMRQLDHAEGWLSFPDSDQGIDPETALEDVKIARAILTNLGLDLGCPDTDASPWSWTRRPDDE